MNDLPKPAWVKFQNDLAFYPFPVLSLLAFISIMVIALTDFGLLQAKSVNKSIQSSSLKNDAPFSLDKIAVITGGVVNVRKAATLKAPVLFKVKRDEIVYIIQHDKIIHTIGDDLGHWVEIIIKKKIPKTGWIFSPFLVSNPNLEFDDALEIRIDEEEHTCKYVAFEACFTYANISVSPKGKEYQVNFHSDGPDGLFDKTYSGNYSIEDNSLNVSIFQTELNQKICQIEDKNNDNNWIQVCGKKTHTLKKVNYKLSYKITYCEYKGQKLMYLSGESNDSGEVFPILIQTSKRNRILTR